MLIIDFKAKPGFVLREIITDQIKNKVKKGFNFTEKKMNIKRE
jgi:hypothetical protein